MFAALFLALLIPLFFTFALRAQLPLLGFEGGSPLIDWVHQNTTGSGFLRKVTGDATFYSVLLWVTLYCKKSYLTPFTVA